MVAAHKIWKRRNILQNQLGACFMGNDAEGLLFYCLLILT